MKIIKYTGQILLILFILSASLFAEIYTWVDENGVKHFGNTNPTEQSAEIEVQEEIEHHKSVDTVKKDDSAWRERMDQKNASENEEKKKAAAQQLADEQGDRAKKAYLSLKKIEEHLLSGVVWSDYKTLLAEASSSLDRIKKETKKSILLTEVYKCYETAAELRRFYNVEKMKSVNRILKKMNEEWETEAKTYFSGRDICWRRAADKLREYDSITD